MQVDLKPIFRLQNLKAHSSILTFEVESMVYKARLIVKFTYSEKVAKFCEIFPLLLTLCTVVKIKGKISQNFVAFSEYMNFNEQ